MSRSAAGWGLMALTLVVLLAHTAASSFARFGKDLWLDPISHARAALDPGSFAELRRDAANNDQPFVGYAVRKYLSVPLLGRSERSLRLPSTVEWMLLVLAVTLFTFLLFRRREGSNLVPPLFAAVVGLWAATHGELQTLSAEGRHYVFTALLSCLWAGFAFLVPRRESVGFFALSCLFANTHVFGLLLTVSLYGAGAAGALLRHDGASFRRSAAAAAALVILFFALNPDLLPRWQRRAEIQLERPPRDTPPAHLWNEFLLFLGLPWWPWAFLGLPFLRRRPGNGALAWLLFGLVPAFLLASRYCIPMRFQPRYFTPFLGLGFVCLCLTLDTLCRRGSALGALAVALALGSGLEARRVPESLANFLQTPFPPANASRYYQLSRAIRSQGLPTIWISAHGNRGFGPVIDGFYWHYLDDTPPPPALFLAVKREQPGRMRRLESFLGEHPDPLVVLQRAGQRFQCPEPPSDPRLRTARVAFADRCLVLVRGVRKPEQVTEMVAAVAATLSPPRRGRREDRDAG